jgi:hypothetical protein
MVRVHRVEAFTKTSNSVNPADVCFWRRIQPVDATLPAVLQGKPPAVAATEGVSCDVCHRITDVKGTGDFAFGPKDIKLGPYKDSKSPYHKTAYAPLIQTSKFCDSCHGQLNNHNGLTVCNTEGEWGESRYAKEGKTCQSCHMPAATGSAAIVPGAPEYAPKNRPLRSHLFLGPNNDPALLREAATLKQVASKTGDGTLEIRVSVTNSGAGHDLPTGLPDRLITLKVEAKDAAGNVLWQNWRHNAYREDRQAAFGLFGFNAQGGEVPPMGASRLVRLNLKPGATRVLRYRLPPGIARKVVHVESRLTYHAARPENVAYFGVWGLPGTQPKPDGQGQYGRALKRSRRAPPPFSRCAADLHPERLLRYMNKRVPEWTIRIVTGRLSGD